MLPFEVGCIFTHCYHNLCFSDNYSDKRVQHQMWDQNGKPILCLETGSSFCTYGPGSLEVRRRLEPENRQRMRVLNLIKDNADVFSPPSAFVNCKNC